ncbi:MAG: hypothetical protein ACLFVF_07605 [Thiohalospira sp.]
MTNLVLIILLFLVSAALWWLFSIEYRKYRTALLRQRLFALRDRFFQEAASGKIDFDSEGYKITRKTINGMIRFAHEIDIWRLIGIIALMKTSRSAKQLAKYNNSREHALSEAPDEQKKLVIKTEVEMHFYVLAHIIHTNIFLFLLLTPFIFFFKRRIKRKWNKDSLSLEKRMHYLDAAALEAGGDGVQFQHAF